LQGRGHIGDTSVLARCWLLRVGNQPPNASAVATIAVGRYGPASAGRAGRRDRPRDLTAPHARFHRDRTHFHVYARPSPTPAWALRHVLPWVCRLARGTAAFRRLAFARGPVSSSTRRTGFPQPPCPRATCSPASGRRVFYKPGSGRSVVGWRERPTCTWGVSPGRRRRLRLWRSAPGSSPLIAIGSQSHLHPETVGSAVRWPRHRSAVRAGSTSSSRPLGERSARPALDFRRRCADRDLFRDLRRRRHVPRPARSANFAPSESAVWLRRVGARLGLRPPGPCRCLLY
jgi:hypothetical protein